MKGQHEDFKTQMQAIEEGQLNASTVQNTTTVQLNANVQTLSTQMEALMALERSLMGGETALQKSLLEAVRQGVTQNHTIIQNQQQILGQVQELKTICSVNQEIPPQVLLSTPVILLDARGRSAPFHLEFIDSAEAFVAVLKIRFKDIGLRKIETEEYTLEDTRRKQALKLTDPWTKIVKPGQHIGMSMIFRVYEPPTTKCPNCGKENEGSNIEDIVW